MHFDLSKFKGMSVMSFDMEEMTGRDSIDAAARAAGPRSDGPTPSGFQLNVLHRSQLIAAAISKVNGDDVVRPYVTWEEWSLRTQEFVMSAYMRLNEATKDEIDSFIKAHFGDPGEASAPISSGNGSTLSGI